MNTVTVYRSEGDRYRWRIQAGNSEIVDASTQSYVSLQACKKNMQRNGHPIPPPWQRGANSAITHDGGVTWKFSFDR